MTKFKPENIKMQKRIDKFIQLLAEQLHNQLSASEEAEALSFSSTALKNLVQSSIQDLPESSLKKSLLQNDGVLELLLQVLQNLNPPKRFLLQSRKDRLKAVKDEVDGFLKDFRNETIDGPKYCQIFAQMLQATDDPPLELLWSFATVKLMQTERQEGVSTDGVMSRVSVAKTLFRCLTACTVGQSCSASISIASLVPVLVMFGEIVAKLAVNSDCKNLDKTNLKNLKNIAGEIAGYIVACGYKDKKSSLKLSLARVLPCCAALLSSVNVWEREKGLKCSMDEIFPLTTAGMQAVLLKEDCSVEYLANVIILEASLLQFVLEIVDRRRMSKGGCGNVGRDEELRKNLKLLAVSCVATVKNANFLDILLELLLESNLPVTALLSQEEEVLLRGVLYEATTLVDYSSLKQDREYICNETKSDGDKSDITFLNRLIVAHQAVQLLRSLGERSLAVSFAKAFSNVTVPSDVMKWIMSQKSELKQYGACIQNPQALVGLLVNLEDQKKLLQILNKHPVFNTIKLPAEVVDLNLGSNAATIALSSNLKDSEVEDIFFIDTKGEVDGGKEGEEFELTGRSFVRAARGMGSIENDRKKMRKIKGKKKQQISFQRHTQHDMSTKENRLRELGSDLSRSEESDLESAGISDKRKRSRIEMQQ